MAVLVEPMDPINQDEITRDLFPIQTNIKTEFQIYLVF